MLFLQASSQKIFLVLCVGRLLQNTLWDIEDGEDAIAPSQMAVAAALRRR